MHLEKPDWVENGTKTKSIINRTLVLWELQRQGKLDLSHGMKSQLAEMFGVGRNALDRSLAAVVEAQDDVDQFLRKIDPTYLQQQAKQTKRARQLYAQRSVKGTFLDEDEYKHTLKAAGLKA